jgi:hypothetical protein
VRGTPSRWESEKLTTYLLAQAADLSNLSPISSLGSLQPSHNYQPARGKGKEYYLSKLGDFTAPTAGQVAVAAPAVVCNANANVELSRFSFESELPDEVDSRPAKRLKQNTVRVQSATALVEILTQGVQKTLRGCEGTAGSTDCVVPAGGQINADGSAPTFGISSTATGTATGAAKEEEDGLDHL